MKKKKTVIKSNLLSFYIFKKKNDKKTKKNRNTINTKDLEQLKILQVSLD